MSAGVRSPLARRGWRVSAPSAPACSMARPPAFMSSSTGAARLVVGMGQDRNTCAGLSVSPRLIRPSKSTHREGLLQGIGLFAPPGWAAAGLQIRRAPRQGHRQHPPSGKRAKSRCVPRMPNCSVKRTPLRGASQTQASGAFITKRAKGSHDHRGTDRRDFCRLSIS